jgi:hypothetical protein
MQFVVVMLRGGLDPLTYNDSTKKRAMQRVWALLELHSVRGYAETTEGEVTTLTVDASTYYGPETAEQRPERVSRRRKVSA